MEISEDLIIEANELFDDAEKALMNIDQSDDFDLSFNIVFRAFHSVKGAAGMFGLDELQGHMHHLESYLEQCKQKNIIAEQLVDYFLKGIDAARDYLKGEALYFDRVELAEILNDHEHS